MYKSYSSDETSSLERPNFHGPIIFLTYPPRLNSDLSWFIIYYIKQIPGEILFYNRYREVRNIDEPYRNIERFVMVYLIVGLKTINGSTLCTANAEIP